MSSSSSDDSVKTQFPCTLNDDHGSLTFEVVLRECKELRRSARQVVGDFELFVKNGKGDTVELKEVYKTAEVTVNALIKRKRELISMAPNHEKVKIWERDIGSYTKRVQRMHIEFKECTEVLDPFGSSSDDEDTFLGFGVPDRASHHGTFASSVVEQNTREKQNPVVKSEAASSHGGLCTPTGGDTFDKFLRQSMAERKPNSSKFSGNPLHYLSFSNEFQMLIKKFSDDPAYLFDQLIDGYVTGEARSAIVHCKDLLDDPEVALKTALATLKRNFGHDFVVRQAHIKSITRSEKVDWSSVGLRGLLCELEQCRPLLRNEAHSLFLNAPETIKAVVTRLPLRCRQSFVKQTSRLDSHLTADFDFLLKFVEAEHERSCNPFVELAFANPEWGKKSDFKKKEIKKNQSASATDKKTSYRSNTTEVKKCVGCKEEASHSLDTCDSFKKMSPKERRGIVRNKKRCFRCLKFGHMGKECYSKNKCDFCDDDSHHSILCRNGDRASGEEARDVEIHSASVAGRVFVRVVPVRAYTDAGRSIKTYALLDTGSNTTFASTRLAEKLNLKGENRRKIPVTGVNVAKDQAVSDISFHICGLNEDGNDRCKSFYLQSIPCLKMLRSHEQSIPSNEIIAKHKHLNGIKFPKCPARGLDLIIGSDFERLLHVEDSRISLNSNLCAHLTPLGWVLAGKDDFIDPGLQHCVSFIESSRACLEPGSGACVNKCSGPHKSAEENENISICDYAMDEMQKIVNGFPATVCDEDTDISKEDEMVLDMFEQQVCNVDGHYQLPLPLRNPDTILPNNREMVESRLRIQKKLLNRNSDLDCFVRKAFQALINKGHIERCPVDEDSNTGKHWYLPWFCTRQNKPRLVYDAAAQYNGVALNDVLMQGPDLLQPLVDVLVRFRQHPFAFTCDIREMFYQVLLKPEHRDFVRLLWFEDGDKTKDIVDYRFTVHPFGANSSPSAANFAVKKTAIDNKPNVSLRTVNAMLRQCYMDDCLISEKTLQEAIVRANEINILAKSGGFTLAKYASNSKEFLSGLKMDDPSLLLKNLDLQLDCWPVHKTLGVHWDMVNDRIVVKIDIKTQKTTKRGILSMIAQTFDPLGLCIPYLVAGRRVIQDMFALANPTNWDSPLPPNLLKKWNKWIKDLGELEKVYVPRCYYGQGTTPEIFELHSFADASTEGLAAVSYLRYKKDDKWDCSFVRAKAKIVPLKVKWSVPRLELEAAVMAARLHKEVFDALDLEITSSFLWSDSKTVLSWIRNMRRRTKVFVANRRREIHRLTEPEQWSYVATACNPADLGTRSNSLKSIGPNSLWLKGPQFLQEDQSHWPNFTAQTDPVDEKSLSFEWMEEDVIDVHASEQSTGDDIIQCLACSADNSSNSPHVHDLLWRYSAISTLLRKIALLRRVFKPKKRRLTNLTSALTQKEINDALLCALRLAQEQWLSPNLLENIRKVGFHVTIEKLNKSSPYFGKVKNIQKLCPFVDEEGLLRVGGRLQNSDLPNETKHQYLLPDRHHLTRLLVEDAHKRHAHFGGIAQVLCTLREKFWVFRSSVDFYLNMCLTCERLRAKAGAQQMSPLPYDRVNFDARPFHATGIDYMGPLMVKVKRSNVKRWIAVFTCLATRAIHLEVVYDMTTASFLQAFRRFCCARGNTVRVLYSDNATTFKGADAEMKRGLADLESNKVDRELANRAVEWHFNPPYASHQGGVYERMIKSVRKVLAGLPAFLVKTPSDETLLTVLKECEAIINDRPLTYIGNSPDEPSPLTPNMILHGYLCKDIGPLYTLCDSDQYRSSWKYCQVAKEQFRERFIKEYVMMLQPRQKWYKTEPNLRVNEVVLVKDQDLFRHEYPMAVVEEPHPSKDGKVRKVMLRFANGKKLCRDIRKLIPLELVSTGTT